MSSPPSSDIASELPLESPAGFAASGTVPLKTPVSTTTSSLREKKKNKNRKINFFFFHSRTRTDNFEW